MKKITISLFKKRTGIKIQNTNKKLIKSFCGGSRGAVFSKSAPLAAGGKKEKP
jgi:hypothetical protein